MLKLAISNFPMYQEREHGSDRTPPRLKSEFATLSNVCSKLRFLALRLLAAVVFILLHPLVSQAHDDKSGVEYIEGCLKIHFKEAPHEGEVRRFDIGFQNGCLFPVVGVLCADMGSGILKRYALPINSPPGHLHVWSIWEPPKTFRLKAFACRPSGNCRAGKYTHDPHCHN